MPDSSLNLDDPRDDALRETWSLLDGTATGASAFIAIRRDLRAIRALPDLYPATER